jgi:hypothetical protein
MEMKKANIISVFFTLILIVSAQLYAQHVIDFEAHITIGDKYYQKKQYGKAIAQFTAYITGVISLKPPPLLLKDVYLKRGKSYAASENYD